MGRKRPRQKSRQSSGKGAHANRTPRMLILLAVAVIGGGGWWLYTSRTRATAGMPTTVAFQPTVENTQSAPGQPPPGMVWIPGGEFSMGAAESPGMNMVGMQATTDSRPIHRVYVDGFWMDKTEVTNEQFAKFVEATGYVTIAEKAPRAEDFPGAPPENLVAGGRVRSEWLWASRCGRQRLGVGQRLVSARLLSAARVDWRCRAQPAGSRHALRPERAD